MPSAHLAAVSPLSIIGSRIRQAREARGLTVHELATRLGWTVWFTERIEAGQFMPGASLSLTDLMLLGDALQCRIGYLVGERKKP